MPPIYRWSGCNGVAVPAGIIVPFMDVAANIPAGWQQFTGGNNYAILPANAAGATSAGYTSVARTTSTDGAHSDAGAPVLMQCTYNSGTPIENYTILSTLLGAHSHSLTINYTPAKRKQLLVKATANHTYFPPKTGIMSSTFRGDLIDATPTGYLLSGNSGTSSVNVAEIKSATGLTAAGSHSHMNGSGPQLANHTTTTMYDKLGGYGNSVHSNHGLGTPVVTDNIKRFLVGLFYHATKSLPPGRNMIAMWESATPPPGWMLCDGSNGTYDLASHFIGFDSGAGIGTLTGNHTITTSVAVGSGGLHNHLGSYLPGLSGTTGWHSNANLHSHTVGALTSNFYPAYYTLIFITPKV